VAAKLLVASPVQWRAESTSWWGELDGGTWGKGTRWERGPGNGDENKWREGFRCRQGKRKKIREGFGLSGRKKRRGSGFVLPEKEKKGKKKRGKEKHGREKKEKKEKKRKREKIFILVLVRFSVV
jgi:hypothetical protein